MEENYNEEIEKVDETMAEEIPPEPKAPEAPTPNFSSADSSTMYEDVANDPDENTAKVLAIVSLVAGIVSLLCCCITYVAGVAAVAAIVCGIISINKSSSYKGMAIAGIICGGVGIVIFGVIVILGVFASGLANLFENVVDVNEFF